MKSDISKGNPEDNLSFIKQEVEIDLTNELVEDQKNGNSTNSTFPANPSLLGNRIKSPAFGRLVSKTMIKGKLTTDCTMQSPLPQRFDDMKHETYNIIWCRLRRSSIIMCWIFE